MARWSYLETIMKPLFGDDPSRLRRLSGRAFIVAATLLAAIATARPDTIEFDNGDQLTGEVKSLDRGKIRFKTDATDTIEIRWDHVAALTSGQNFEITLDDGRRLLGSLEPGPGKAQVRVLAGAQGIELPALRIVRMTPIEGRLIERIDMNVDLGYSIAKANDVSQTNIGYDFSYRGEKRLLALNFDAATSTAQRQPSSTRINTLVTYRRFFKDRKWDPIGLAQVERNDQLGLDRRATVGGGMSWWLTDTNSNRISFSGGLVYSTEDVVDIPTPSKSAEAMVGLNLDWFRFDYPELDVRTRFAMFERLSGASRTRGNLDVDFRWELIEDFNWGFSVYYSFDSAAEKIGAATSDYGLVTSFGWEF
jgi:Protein of unknown function, DUF481